MKTLIMTGMILGSWIGAYIPTLWGDGVLSFTSVIGSALGGFLGIYIGFQVAKKFDI